MKNIKIFVTLITISLIIFSCSENEITDNQVNNLKSNISLGKIHNDFLTHTLINFDIPKEKHSKEEGLTELANFQIDYMNSLNYNNFDKETAINYFTQMKHLYKIENAMDLLENGVIIENQRFSLTEMNNKLNTDGVISELDTEITNKIIQDLNDNLKGIKTDKDVLNSLKEYKTIWVNSQNSISNKGGDYSSIILDISISSLNWWEENSLEANGHNKVAVWIMTDIVGAIAGADLAATAQNFLNDGEINWSVVAAAGLTTAIASSTGIIGKVGKWLAGLF